MDLDVLIFLFKVLLAFIPGGVGFYYFQRGWHSKNRSFVPGTILLVAGIAVTYYFISLLLKG